MKRVFGLCDASLSTSHSCSNASPCSLVQSDLHFCVFRSIRTSTNMNRTLRSGNRVTYDESVVISPIECIGIDAVGGESFAAAVKLSWRRYNVCHCRWDVSSNTYTVLRSWRDSAPSAANCFSMFRQITNFTRALVCSTATATHCTCSVLSSGLVQAIRWQWYLAISHHNFTFSFRVMISDTKCSMLAN